MSLDAVGPTGKTGPLVQVGRTGAALRLIDPMVAATGAQSTTHPREPCEICDTPTGLTVRGHAMCPTCANVMNRGEPIWVRLLRWVMQ
jgi:hypothetical protein